MKEAFQGEKSKGIAILLLKRVTEVLARILVCMYVNGMEVKLALGI